MAIVNGPIVRLPFLTVKWRFAALAVQLKLARLRLVLKAGFDPNQPRVSAGQPDGGQWTDGGATSFRVAQASSRGSGSRGRGTGGSGSLTPSQLTRLEVSQAGADAAVARVRKIDPNWSPRPGLYQTVEGQIANNAAIQREANDRYAALRTEQVLFGPFTGGRTSGPGPFKRPTEAQQAEVNRLGELFGCHTCGARESGFTSRNWVFDHQGPSALGGPNAGRWGAPHCRRCMSTSGGIIRDILRYK